VVDCAEEQLDDPEVGGEVDWGVGAGHLFLLVLEIGCAVDHRANLRILIKLSKKFLRCLVVSNLCELECNTTTSVLWETLLESVECVSDSIENGILWLTSGLAIGDGNDQDWLPELPLTGLGEYYLINDLLSEGSAHGSKTLKLDATHDLLNLCLSGNAVLERSTLRITDAGEISVHEPKGNSILVEKGSSERDTLQNKAQVLDAAALLFELHRTTVVNVQNNIIQCELDNVVGNLFGYAPALNDLVDLASGILGNLV